VAVGEKMGPVPILFSLNVDNVTQKYVPDGYLKCFCQYDMLKPYNKKLGVHRIVIFTIRPDLPDI
jgi:hypothetical protein